MASHRERKSMQWDELRIIKAMNGKQRGNPRQHSSSRTRSKGAKMHIGGQDRNFIPDSLHCSAAGLYRDEMTPREIVISRDFRSARRSNHRRYDLHFNEDPYASHSNRRPWDYRDDGRDSGYDCCGSDNRPGLGNSPPEQRRFNLHIGGASLFCRPAERNFVGRLLAMMIFVLAILAVVFDSYFVIMFLRSNDRHKEKKSIFAARNMIGYGTFLWKRHERHRFGSVITSYQAKMFLFHQGSIFSTFLTLGCMIRALTGRCCLRPSLWGRVCGYSFHVKNNEQKLC